MYTEKAHPEIFLVKQLRLYNTEHKRNRIVVKISQNCIVADES